MGDKISRVVLLSLGRKAEASQDGHGIYWPAYSGKSCVDNWVVENGGEVGYNCSGWEGKMWYYDALYTFHNQFINLRKTDGDFNFTKSDIKKGNLIFDERLSVWVRHRSFLNKNLVSILEKQGFVPMAKI
ncbi:hypothetical protein CMI46_01485 [Candidatus Pacearchaeota archaeon]|nr:hypothetical protein [Candidatus Pacearchaeota archaeon]|tara:strand:- start:19897 stop:20286 length:390 start_codon:yes stop_codon:yes gene_type:complete